MLFHHNILHKNSCLPFYQSIVVNRSISKDYHVNIFFNFLILSLCFVLQTRALNDCNWMNIIILLLVLQAIFWYLTYLPQSRITKQHTLVTRIIWLNWLLEECSHKTNVYFDLSSHFFPRTTPSFNSFIPIRFP